jgi:acyl-ACP thioesterase
VAPALAGERLDLATWCSGVGSHWAERRVALSGRRGSVIETATLWVRIEPDTGRPASLGPGFAEVFAPAAGGRRVSARLQHDPVVPVGAAERLWALRFVDFDVLGHVNNAGAWAMVEEVLAAVDEGPSWPRRVEVEFREPIVRGDEVIVRWEPPAGPDDEVRLWVLAAAGSGGAQPTVRTTARAVRQRSGVAPMA